MSSLCCHFNWENAGSGRTGNGGVGTSSRLETANLNSRHSVLIIHKEHHRLDILIRSSSNPFVLCRICW
jgi:hypothetical protein